MGAEPIDPLGILGPGGIAGVVGAPVIFNPGAIAGVTGALGGVAA